MTQQMLQRRVARHRSEATYKNRQKPPTQGLPFPSEQISNKCFTVHSPQLLAISLMDEGPVVRHGHVSRMLPEFRSEHFSCQRIKSSGHGLDVLLIRQV